MSFLHRGISPVIEVILASISTPDQSFATMSRPGLDNRVYATGDYLKGKDIYFQTGQWAGRIIRAELHEWQHAELGRKSVSAVLLSSFDLGLFCQTYGSR